MQHDFKASSYLFVNHKDPAPPPPPPDVPEEELLRYYRKNMWVARLQEARASDNRLVWLRIFWLYWPEDTPGGRQHYHGSSELVLSNDPAIIEARTISGMADVGQWDEWDDEEEIKGGAGLYWRQKLDITLGSNNKKALSAVRKHCKCGKEYNPDSTMFRCPKRECETWNHTECLQADLRKTLEPKMANRSIQRWLDKQAVALDKMPQHLYSSNTTITVDDPSSPHAGPNSVAKSLRSPQKGRDRKVPRIENQLVINISNDGLEKSGSQGAVMANVQLFSNANESSSEAKQWLIKLTCLKCGGPLD
jgi:hypothetical protein